MAALSSQCLGNSINASKPIIEDITELCDYCIKLTEAMVTDPGHALRGWSTWPSYTKVSTLDSGPETCRLCEIITKDLHTQRQQLGIEGSPFTPMDWKKSQLDISRIYRSTGVFSCDPVALRQICGADIQEFEYAIWADEGDEKTKPPSYRSADEEIRQSGECSPD
jgi:hypothetical protein